MSGLDLNSTRESGNVETQAQKVLGKGRTEYFLLTIMSTSDFYDLQDQQRPGLEGASRYCKVLYILISKERPATPVMDIFIQ